MQSSKISTANQSRVRLKADFLLCSKEFLIAAYLRKERRKNWCLFASGFIWYCWCYIYPRAISSRSATTAIYRSIYTSAVTCIRNWSLPQVHCNFVQNTTSKIYKARSKSKFLKLIVYENFSVSMTGLPSNWQLTDVLSELTEQYWPL